MSAWRCSMDAEAPDRWINDPDLDFANEDRT